MKTLIKTKQSRITVNGRQWDVYMEAFKTVKHVYIKPIGYEFYIQEFTLKGAKYKLDHRWCAERTILGLEF